MSGQHEAQNAAPKKRNRGGRPKKVDVIASVLSSPEGQEAISAAVAAVLSKLNVSRAEAGTAPLDGDASFARQLATAIGEISDQGSKVRRVSPAELEKRRIARERMEDMLIAARADGTVPEYELSAAVYLDEQLVAPTYVDRQHIQRRTQIAWPKVPNEHMRPISNAAKNIFAAFMESIGGPTSAVRRTDDVLPEQPDESGLKVLHQGERREVAHVSKPRMHDLQIINRNLPGTMTETNVLGSISAPARQIT